MALSDWLQFGSGHLCKRTVGGAYGLYCNQPGGGYKLGWQLCLSISGTLVGENQTVGTKGVSLHV